MLYGLLAGCLIGIPMIAFWYFAQRRGKQSLSWPHTPGTIVDSRLVEVRDSDGDRTTQASIRYTYRVGSAEYVGSTVAVGGGGKPSATVQKYPAGAAVQVFYDPQKPTRAVLEPGAEGTSALFIAGLVIIAFCTGVGIFRGSSANASDASAEQYRAATNLYQQGKYAEARTAFESLAEKGSPEAEVYLGVMQAKGQGEPQNFVEAEKWFILAGDAGAKNREELRKGLTPAQEQEANQLAATWKAAHP